MAFSLALIIMQCPKPAIWPLSRRKRQTSSGRKQRSKGPGPAGGSLIWRLEKIKSSKNGSRSYYYRMATWREKSRNRNVHLGSCAKMDAGQALQKARQEKARALGSGPIELDSGYVRRSGPVEGYDQQDHGRDRLEGDAYHAVLGLFLLILVIHSASFRYSLSLYPSASFETLSAMGSCNR